MPSTALVNGMLRCSSSLRRAPQCSLLHELNVDVCYTEVQTPRWTALILQVAGFDEEDGGASPSHKKGSRAGRREGRVKSKGGADGEPGAAIAGATLRMSSWPPNDQEVVNTAFEEAVPVTVLQYLSTHCAAA